MVDFSMESVDKITPLLTLEFPRQFLENHFHWFSVRIGIPLPLSFVFSHPQFLSYTHQRFVRGPERDEVTDDSEKGYQIGPMEMLKLGDDEMEELKRLRRENEILKKKVAQYKVERETCVREHGELEELRRRVRDLEREKEDRNRFTSYVKTETVSKVKKEEPGEYFEGEGIKHEEILID